MNKKNRINKIILKILNLILNFFTIVIVICLLTLVIQKAIYKGDVPSLLGIKVLQVLSGSMSGTFEEGDLIIINKVKNENDLKPGDIVSFKEKDSIVTHRIIDITKNKERLEYTTKGDANSSEDLEKIYFKDIEGRYVFKFIFLG